jgi:hypothetical protein
MQHRLCARMLGLSIDNHRVFVARVPAAVLRVAEKAINARLLARHRAVFTNQRSEVEQAFLGEAWT